MKKWLGNIALLVFGIFLAILAAEVILHFYNPFKSRVRGNEIVLPANVKYEFSNIHIRGLDTHIIHTKNSLGFRGPELSDTPGKIKIFCVGGSTTECFYLSDGHDWPALVMSKLNASNPKYWIDNAGLDGHSTRGHIILLRDHLLKYKPDMVLFLIGCNDVAAAGLNKFEKYHLAANTRLLQKSELFNLYFNWRMSRNASKMGMGHKPVDFSNWPVKDTSGWTGIFAQLKSETEQNLIEAYSRRVDTLIALCKQAGVRPVLVTQPTILGDRIDPVSGRYLGNIDFLGECGLAYRNRLNAYNQVLKSKHVQVIDAATLLAPSSENYYDFFHYTNHGANELASVIANQMKYPYWGEEKR